MLKEEQRSLTFTWIQLFLKFCLWACLCPCLCLLEFKKWLHLSVCFENLKIFAYVHEFPLIRPISFYNTFFFTMTYLQQAKKTPRNDQSSRQDRNCGIIWNGNRRHRSKDGWRSLTFSDSQPLLRSVSGGSAEGSSEVVPCFAFVHFQRGLLQFLLPYQRLEPRKRGPYIYLNQSISWGLWDVVTCIVVFFSAKTNVFSILKVDW